MERWADRIEAVALWVMTRTVKWLHRRKGMTDITTTLNRIRAHGPCRKGWEKLLAGLGKTAPDDEPLPFARIVEINGLSDALWCCRAEPQHAREWRLFAVWCARQVAHLMTDPRSIAALDVAERHANGQATGDELAVAADAAWAAAAEANPAARDAAWAAQKAEFLRVVGIVPPPGGTYSNE